MKKCFLIFLILLLNQTDFSTAQTQSGSPKDTILQPVDKPNLTEKNTPETADPEYYQPYLKLLKEVYETMDNEYYRHVSKEKYTFFVNKYKNSVLSKLTDHQNRIDRVAHIGAGLLVNSLRTPEDKFTNFVPPKQAEEYSKQIYGYENGLGIEGKLIDNVFLISHVQIRSDAFMKGIRQGDKLLKLNKKPVSSLSPEKIKEILYPPLNKTIKLTIFSKSKNKPINYSLVCKEYFIETVEALATKLDRTFCLKIKSFNRKTADDFKEYITKFKQSGIDTLIVDVTDNPGGPPLAVRELSGIFLPANEKLFFYQKKNVPQFGLTAPESEITYTGKLIVLVNSKSGSASELFAGTLQAHKRAKIIGKDSTAGYAFLKKTFKFDDGSMIALLTGDSYLFNGQRISVEGVAPDMIIPKETNSLNYVLDLISSKNQ
ncbi:MAG: S41 family peptidase [Candidatus Omnitrophica bacterium]|nr:S41 family peptidase [Candidatus Omnitrophota bacterium]